MYYIVYVYMPNSRTNIENTSFDHLMKFTKYSLANQAWWDIYIYIYCKQYSSLFIWHFSIFDKPLVECTK